MRRILSHWWVWVILAAAVIGLVAFVLFPDRSDDRLLRLATTTSTADSGLLDEILPDFCDSFDAKVDVIAVGTGQALETGRRGDVDVVLVHARSLEDEFLAEGYATTREDVMYNDFVIVGPIGDPANIGELDTATLAFDQIAATNHLFASRGDNSGTHSKEQQIWQETGRNPTADDSWYKPLGQGMGATLVFANEKPAYTLTDRGTFLSMKDGFENLAIVVGGSSIDENIDKMLMNPYGVLPVDSDRFSWVNDKLAGDFVSWLTSQGTQQAIGEYGREKFGHSLFYPATSRTTTKHSQ